MDVDLAGTAQEEKFPENFYPRNAPVLNLFPIDFFI